MDNKETTPEVEIKNCAGDFLYFCETYVKVIHPIRGLVNFKLYDYQKRYVKALADHRFVIAPKFRQGGFTTLTCAWLLWRFLFKQDEANMVMTKSDREACYTSSTVRRMIDYLPEFLKPKMSKCNDHSLVSEDTNCKMWFLTCEAACGRAINYLFIDEPAFIKDMDKHWKAMYPVLSTGGHCIATSSVNGAEGWFFETVKGAFEKKNDFFLFTAEYHEHPDYNDPNWVAQTRRNLGDRGWRQEVLCEFLKKQSLKDRLREGVDFLCEITAVEEEDFIKRKEAEFKAKYGSTQEFLNKRKDERKKEDWKIRTNADKAKLVFEDCDYNFEHGYDSEECDMNFCDWVYKMTDFIEPVKEGDTITVKADRPKPHVHEFAKLSHDEIKSIFKKDHEGYKADEVKHPKFAEQRYGNAEEMAELFSDLGDDSWKKRLQKQKNWWHQLEDRIEYYCDPDILALSGIITKAEAASMGNCPLRPDLVILHKLTESGDFPENIALSFLGGHLCVNEVPTRIKEEDVRDAYNGFYALTSHKEAVDTVVGLLKEKLKPLFGTEEKDGITGSLTQKE
jgi:hypothetical protein